MPPQNDVRFDGDQANEFGQPPMREGGFSIIGMLVQWGLVQNDAQAQYVLLAIALVAISIAIGAQFI